MTHEIYVTILKNQQVIMQALRALGEVTFASARELDSQTEMTEHLLRRLAEDPAVGGNELKGHDHATRD